MENRIQMIAIKEWFYDKTEDVSSRYNCFIDFERDENGNRKVEDGCVFVTVEEVLNESEKAVQVRLRTGDIVGSVKGWKTWIPKSVIK